jgi:plastocyanin
MRVIRKFCVAGVFVALTGVLGFAADEGDAIRFNVPIDNLANQPEPGSGLAEVTLANGKAEVEMQGLRTVPHDDPLGAGRIVGYAAWLVNSESALGKLNMGFLFPEDNGEARLNFSASGADKSNLSRQGFNMVVITAETVLDLTRPQPSGPPIAAGHIPGAPAATTPPVAVEVFMGDLTRDVFGFQEETITLFSGQTVRWTSVSPAFIDPHTATRTEGTDPPAFFSQLSFDSGSVPFGGSFTQTFTLPAGVVADVYGYHCTTHLALGMTGRIVVVARPTS